VNRTYLLCTGVLFFAGMACAESPFIAPAKADYETIKNNIVKAAEKMPDSAYSFQATPEERTWGALMGHIADAQTRICSAAAGETKPANAGKLTSKADLVNALKASNEVCDAVWAATTEANASTSVKRGNRELTRLNLLIYNTQHDNESYGTMAVYLRLKGIVPPSSEK